MNDKKINTSENTKIETQEQPSGLAVFFGFDNLKSLAILILAIFAFRWSVMSPYHVPTASMEPTIKIGDRLLANKLAYNLKLPFTDLVLVGWSTPRKGDIVVFRYPKDRDIDYVKRVVAVAGDEVELREDVLYVNGQEQTRLDHNNDRSILDDTENPDVKRLFRENLAGKEHWVMQDEYAEKRFMRSRWPLDGRAHRVPSDSIFVMGDNRDNSNDSRAWGEVPLGDVRGKAIVVFWSVFSPHEGWPQIRLTRFGHWLQ